MPSDFAPKRALPLSADLLCKSPAGQWMAVKFSLQLLDLIGLGLDVLGHLHADRAQLIRIFRQGFEGLQHGAIYTGSLLMRERKTALNPMFCWQFMLPRNQRSPSLLWCPPVDSFE